MPYIFERPKPQVANTAPFVAPSKIPAKTRTGIDHASKPSLSTIPITPARKLINNQNLARRVETAKRLEIDPEIAILELVSFARQPIVSFGKVQLGKTKAKQVAIRNLHDVQQQLFVRAFPRPEKCFTIDATEFLIAPRTEIQVSIAWSPRSLGSFRETITLQDINRIPRRIVLMGTAIPENLPAVPNKLSRFVTSRVSPSKLHRKLVVERTQKLFSPKIRRRVGLEKFAHKTPLKKLVFESKRRQSGQIVKKILSQHDEAMAIRVQSYWRMILAKRHVSSTRESILKIQSYWRLALVKRQVEKMKNSILVIQSFWRMALARREFQQKRQSILKIQSYMRVLLAKRQVARRKLAILTIQSYWRMALVRLQYKKTKQSILIIQSCWRMAIVRHRVEMLKNSAVVIQSYWRMVIAMRLAEKKREQILKIQSYWRMILAKRDARKTKEAIITIQSHWRRIVAQRQAERKRKSIVTIQSFWRMTIARRHAKQAIKSVTKIQSYIRMIMCQRQFREILERRQEAATLIQSHYRAMVVRRDYQKLRTIIRLQSHFRGSVARKIYNRRKLAMRLIKGSIEGFQSCSRGFLVRAPLRRSVEALMKILAVNECRDPVI